MLRALIDALRFGRSFPLVLVRSASETPLVDVAQRILKRYGQRRQYVVWRPNDDAGETALIIQDGLPNAVLANYANGTVAGVLQPLRRDRLNVVVADGLDATFLLELASGGNQFLEASPAEVVSLRLRRSRNGDDVCLEFDRPKHYSANSWLVEQVEARGDVHKFWAPHKYIGQEGEEYVNVQTAVVGGLFRQRRVVVKSITNLIGQCMWPPDQAVTDMPAWLERELPWMLGKGRQLRASYWEFLNKMGR